MLHRFTCWLAFAALPLFALAQLQAPSEFLHRPLGGTFTPHHQLVDYFQHVAANSANVQLLEYGRTNEDRPLLLAFASTAANLAQLEAIRLNHLRRAGLAEGAPDPALDRAIVWLSYSVHGNEAAGSEASMGVVYDLANTGNANTQEWLQNTIVILDPSVNPDGYSRYSHWYRGVATTDRDINPSVREHREPWPGGRTNHYMFDLNRDWAWQTQVESQQRIVTYQRWMPHVHADLHEQYYNNPYYFAPAAQPYHAYITEWQSNFQTEIGKNHARYFDAEGWLYFTREVFDLLYPSYGDTYPTFNGAIGMTYEQGGHSRGGSAILMPNNDTLTLYDRVAHHRTTSLSTVEIASKSSDRLVQEFTDYFTQATNNPTGPYKTYVIRGNQAQPRLRALLQLLDRNGIVYGHATGKNSISAFDYQTGKNANISIGPNDLVISAYQPRSVLTQALLDPTTTVVDSLTYDITAWSLPYAYGLEAYATTSKVPVEQGFTPAPANSDLGVEPHPYAYLVGWSGTEDARFLAQLLKAGIVVRASSTTFQLRGKTYAPGTLVLTRGDNRKNADFDETVRQLARTHQVQINAIGTGFTDNGPDLGSSAMTLLKAPRVAMLAGEGTYSNETGQVWHYFEQRLDYPIHIYYPDELDNWTGADVDVLILPEGYYKLSDEMAASLAQWVRGGGKLIGIGDALSALAGKAKFGLNYKAGEEGQKPTPPYEDHTYAGAERRSIADAIPGAIFGVDMDQSHPLAFGLPQPYFSLKTGTAAFAPLEDGWNVGQLGAAPLVSGFVGGNARTKMQNTLTFGVQEYGRGTMVYLVDNPLYRGFWENGTFLFSNAVFMVGN
ncbi:MAG: zinc carboxypeptidase [Bacteroidetes bacterium]|nr:MAG: zinc carboxypeptidase [Bacteroidota bacterium]PTM09436.1 MAG: zinc carboxypeptidase [Bacteroidota bacterium]